MLSDRHQVAEADGSVAVKIAVYPGERSRLAIVLGDLHEIGKVDLSITVGIAGKYGEVEDVIVAARAVAIAIEREAGGVADSGGKQRGGVVSIGQGNGVGPGGALGSGVIIQSKRARYGLSGGIIQKQQIHRIELRRDIFAEDKTDAVSFDIGERTGDRGGRAAGACAG